MAIRIGEIGASLWLAGGRNGAMGFVRPFWRGWERGRAESKFIRPKVEALWLDWADQRSPKNPPTATPHPLDRTVILSHPGLFIPSPCPSLTWRPRRQKPKSRCTFQQLLAICSASQIVCSLSLSFCLLHYSKREKKLFRPFRFIRPTVRIQSRTTRRRGFILSAARLLFRFEF